MPVLPVMKDNYLDSQAKKEAREIAVKALRIYFGLEKEAENPPHSPTLFEKRGVFVTLYTQGKLRGCLGEIETDQPLYKSIKELAVAAATRDWRFMPVTKADLQEIKIEISILTKPIKVADWHQIVLGRDGVIVERDGRKGIFLPQVAKEGQFTLEEFLGLLCSQKAGLESDAYQDPQTNLFTFNAEVF